MKKYITTLVLSALSLNSQAANVIPSNADVRLDANTTARNVQYTLDEKIEKLEGKEGFIKAKVKLSKEAKKLLKLNAPKSSIYIPYTKESNIQSSLPIEFSLKDPEATISSAQTLSYKVVFKKKQRKKFNIENYTGNINIDVVNSDSTDAGVALHGVVNLPDISGSDSGSDSTDGKARIIPFAEGDSEAAGATVKVYEVMPDGSVNKSGDPVAEGVVDAKGEFDIQLPPPDENNNYKPGPDLIVEVDGLEDGSKMMHSFIDEEEMVVDPKSEFVFEEITDAMNKDMLTQDNLSATEIKDFHERVDDMGQNDELTIDETVDKLMDNVGPLVDNIIPALDDTEEEPDKFDFSDFDIKDFNPTDDIFKSDDLIPSVIQNAENIAGSYNVAFYYGIVGAELQSIVAQYGGAVLSRPTETGVIDAFPQFRLRSEANFVNQANFGGNPSEEGEPVDPPEGEPVDPPIDGVQQADPCYELTAVTDIPTGGTGFEGGKDGEGEGGGLFFTVDDLNVISVIESESTESVGANEVFKFTSSVTDFLPVGEGMFLGTNIRTGGNFDATTGAYNFGLEHNSGFAIMIKKSDLAVEDLAENYGFVGFSSLYKSGGELSLSSKYGSVSFAGDTASFSFDNQVLTREAPVDKNVCNSMVISSTTESETGTGKVTIDSEGTLEITDSSTLSLPVAKRRNFFEGYARPDAGILTFLSYFDVAEDGSFIAPTTDSRQFQDISEGDRTIHFGVKLSSAQTGAPEVTGTNFEMHSYEVTLDSTGNVKIETPVSGSRNNLSFGSGTVSINAGTDNVAEGDSTTVPSKTTEANASGSDSLILGVDGSMVFTINGITYRGYVAEDLSAVILVSHSADKMGIHFCTRDLLEL